MIIVLHTDGGLFYVSAFISKHSETQYFKVSENIINADNIDEEDWQDIRGWYDRKWLEECLEKSNSVSFGIHYVNAIEFRETYIDVL